MPLNNLLPLKPFKSWGGVEQAAMLVAHVILVSPQSQLDFDLDCFGFGSGFRGLDLGLGLDN